MVRPKRKVNKKKKAVGKRNSAGVPKSSQKTVKRQKEKMKIGIVAVQGDFAAHAAMLRELGAETIEVRTVADLQECDG
jgi:hypothetical protein